MPAIEKEKTGFDVLSPMTDICDELSGLRLLLEKSRVVHEEVNQEFFRFPATDGLSDVDKATIIYNYDTASVKADIVDDYLIRMDEVLTPLLKTVSQLQRQLRKEKYPNAGS